MKYIAPIAMLLISNEVLSLIALCVMAGMFLFDIAAERERYRE